MLSKGRLFVLSQEEESVLKSLRREREMAEAMERHPAQATVFHDEGAGPEHDPTQEELQEARLLRDGSILEADKFTLYPDAEIEEERINLPGTPRRGFS